MKTTVLGEVAVEGVNLAIAATVDAGATITVVPEPSAAALASVDLALMLKTPRSEGGWYLSDSSSLTKYQIASPTILNGDQSTVLDDTQFGFGFKGDGDDEVR